MPLNTDAKNAMLTSLAGVAVKLALLNGSSVELSGGSPAYARKDATWGTASGGAISMTNDPVFDVPAGSTVAYVRVYNTAGTVQYGDFPITNETYGGQGTYTLTAFDLNLNK